MTEDKDDTKPLPILKALTALVTALVTLAGVYVGVEANDCYKAWEDSGVEVRMNGSVCQINITGDVWVPSRAVHIGSLEYLFREIYDNEP